MALAVGGIGEMGCNMGWCGRLVYMIFSGEYGVARRREMLTQSV